MQRHFKRRVYEPNQCVAHSAQRRNGQHRARDSGTSTARSAAAADVTAVRYVISPAVLRQQSTESLLSSFVRR